MHEGGAVESFEDQRKARGGRTGTERRIGRALVPIEKVEPSVYVVPTDAPESDGTLEWTHTTLVVVHVTAGGKRGIGYTYANGATGAFVSEVLAKAVEGRDAMSPPDAFEAMVHEIRNMGRPGVASNAISAVDAALWDLKAKLFGLPLVVLLGAVRDAVPVYGSGGFTSYDDDRLEEQLSAWVRRGIPCVKMKIGRDPARDPARIRRAREAIGEAARLFVDANGAYSRKQALAHAERMAAEGVVWFEEPVTSDDLEGLRLLRDRAPAGMDIAAGEYGYSLPYFERMLAAGAVDVLQADATRCGGVTGFLRTDVLCQARSMPLSAHCAPALHLHLGCATPSLRNLEYFHDHDRIEHLLFEGAPDPADGLIAPDLSRPGLGIELKTSDAERFRIGIELKTSDAERFRK